MVNQSVSDKITNQNSSTFFTKLAGTKINSK
jgi:hypothetical protein